MQITTGHLFVGLLLGMLVITGCSRSEDEQQIRQHISAMRNAITAHHPDNFMQYIDVDYKSPVHQTRDALEKFVKLQLGNNKVIHLYLADIDIEFDDGKAKVTFYSGVAGGPDQIPERGRLFKVGTHWRNTEGVWKITQAKWRPTLIQKE